MHNTSWYGQFICKNQFRWIVVKVFFIFKITWNKIAAILIVAASSMNIEKILNTNTGFYVSQMTSDLWFSKEIQILYNWLDGLLMVLFTVFFFGIYFCRRWRLVENYELVLDVVKVFFLYKTFRDIWYFLLSKFSMIIVNLKIDLSSIYLKNKPVKTYSLHLLDFWCKNTWLKINFHFSGVLIKKLW